MKQYVKRTLRLFLTGFAMGAADIVPGVSGGTIAFILGVYEELIFSIKKITGEILGYLISFKFKKAVTETPFTFLTPLAIGIISAFILLSSLISHLLEVQAMFVWSFFFGLVLASIFIVKKRVVTWDLRDCITLAAASVLAFFVVGLVPVNTPATPLAFFLSGAIAIVAMILPGVSGSFILVLLGKYEQVLHAVVERDVLVLGLVLLGAALGLAIFSRVLSWLFAKHHDIAIVSLTGFMIGSLRKIWPWNGEIALNGSFMASFILVIFGIGIMVYLDKLQLTKEQTADIEDKDFAQKHKKSLKREK